MDEHFYHEMDEEFYHFLSECVCSFFRKVDANKTHAVSCDIMQICFSVIDINLSEAHFNVLVNE
eukprot:CAMPEP_0197035830 /NCGR_PEP_ID=MMETSP1384-20130603/13510_1 /TAXON_ID=29189 /ORGANISM="Ammonia sp." /LENGTH=63 /DNA_ID=CAMNT_0042465929 /DNA_START=295 /DNA_END=483 /DNA_ORIENTATION=+